MLAFSVWLVDSCGVRLCGGLESVAAGLAVISVHLDERAWRLLLGAESKVLGRGGIKLIAAGGGVQADTVAEGVRELDYDEPLAERVDQPGAGRGDVGERPTVVALDAQADPVARGDAESRCGRRCNRLRSWPSS